VTLKIEKTLKLEKKRWLKQSPLNINAFEFPKQSIEHANLQLSVERKERKEEILIDQEKCDYSETSSLVLNK